MRKVLLGGFLLATFAMTPVFAASTTTTSTASHDAVQGNELLFGINTGSALAPDTTSLTVPVQVDPSFVINVKAAVGYQRAVMPNLQVGVRGFMGIATTAQAWNIQPWATYNFDEKWTDSVFIGAGIGILNQQTVAGFLDINIGAEIGKRFEICHGLTWRPNVSMTKVLNGSVIGWAVNPVQLSYMW